MGHSRNTPEPWGRYRASAAVAEDRGQQLRIVLRIDDPILACLPWEAMYDEVVGGYTCRRHQLARHVPVASSALPLTVDPPLRILGIVSSPRGLPALDVEKEQAQLVKVLAPWSDKGLVEVEWAPSASWADLHDMLLGDTWHVLHFIGHGDFDPKRDEGVLALASEDGQTDLVEASRLVDLLCQARPMPRLVVLNSCSGAESGVVDLFSGTAAALVRGGVSAVAAMQYEISDMAAIRFARGFYKAITESRGVDEAVSAGRLAILGLGSHTLEWVTPVLYMRGYDSRLFAIPAISAPLGVSRDESKDRSYFLSGASADPLITDGPNSDEDTPLHLPGDQVLAYGGLPSEVSGKDPGTLNPRILATQEPEPTANVHRSHFKRWTMATGAVITVASITLVLMFLNNLLRVQASSHSHNGGTAPSQDASNNSLKIISETTGVSARTLQAVGVGNASSEGIRKAGDNTTAIHGKPTLLYISAVWCPFCAADQWAMVVALSRFGTFTNLRLSRSAPNQESFPSIATISFLASSYSSRYLTFTSVENQTVTKGSLQPTTPDEQALWDKYDKDSYPFLDIGNKYIADVLDDPQALRGKSQQEIASALNNPSSPIAESVDGAANELIAAICQVTGEQPQSICNSPTIAIARTYLLSSTLSVILLHGGLCIS